jgi:drug/metabolite transporter superfamily protein YnfA
MKLSGALLILFSAAVLEAGGDALIRLGLHAATPTLRGLWFLAGALILFGYGWVVNAPPWDFGRLLGLYVVFFFVVAQLISYLVFGQKPAATVLIGGAFIVIGGFIISLA